MNIAIKDIAYHLPERCITNDEFHEQHPDWDMNLVRKRAGVEQRYIADEHETALDLAAHACKKLFSMHEQLQQQIDGIIFCTQSADYIMPPNSYVLHGELDLSESVFAFDTTLACSGYIYGLAMAQGLIQSGQAANILLVNADTYSKYIHPEDRSARVLFGDGAAVSWIAASESGRGLIDVQCASSGQGHKKFIIQAGGLRMPKSEETSRPIADDSGNVRTLETIHMDGMGILAFVNTKVTKQIRDVLTRNNLTVETIDRFIFHQASNMALDSLARLLRIPADKEFRNLQNVGNTVSASIPIALKDAIDSGNVKSGDTLLLSGFGVGLSWGTAILEIE